MIELETKTEGSWPAAAWCEDFRAKHECPRCFALDKSLRNGPIDVWLRDPPTGAPLDGPKLPVVGMARREFLALFKAEMEGHFHLGRVLDSTGRPFEDYVTFIGVKPIIVRGGKLARFQFCDECGAFCYGPGPARLRYVVRSQLTDQHVYESYPGGLLVDEELAGRIDRKKWRRLIFTKVEVRDRPVDGLDIFPENFYYRGAPET